MSFAYALLALNLLATRQLSPGAQLHIRLATPISSYASRSGDRVDAVLIAPVVSNGEVVFSAGSLVSGKLKSVQKVGFGLVHELAGFDLEFSELGYEGERNDVAAYLDTLGWRSTGKPMSQLLADNGRPPIPQGNDSVSVADTIYYTSIK